MNWNFGLGGVALLAAAHGGGGPSAARFVVDLGADGTGRCVPDGDSGGACNLRAAILAAASIDGPATIDLAVDATIDAGAIAVTTTELVIENAAPNGAARAIIGDGTSRLFDVAQGASLTLRQVTIAGFATHCFDVGAMTAFATCAGGAIDNAGTLTLDGTTFANNRVTAEAETAMFTNAAARGGAIASSGTIAIAGPVSFVGNVASASAHSGVHPAPIGGASASALGGAIDSAGSLVVTAPAGSCRFAANAASAAGSSPQGTTTLASRGGAIESGGTLVLPDGACVFDGNDAQVAPDVDAVTARPAAPPS